MIDTIEMPDIERIARFNKRKEDAIQAIRRTRMDDRGALYEAIGVIMELLDET